MCQQTSGSGSGSASQSVSWKGRLRSKVRVAAGFMARIGAAGAVGRGAVVGLACTGHTVARAAIVNAGSAVSTGRAAAGRLVC
jgi:hypothetical protein